MPNLFSKLFRRKAGESDKDALVQPQPQPPNSQNRRNRKPSRQRGASPRRNNTSVKERPNAAVRVAGQNSDDANAPAPSAHPGVMQAHQQHSKAREAAHSTTSTSKTAASDRDSPPTSEEAEHLHLPRQGNGLPANLPPSTSQPTHRLSPQIISPKAVRNGPDLSFGSHRVLSPRNQLPQGNGALNHGPHPIGTHTIDLDSPTEDENYGRGHVQPQLMTNPRPTVFSMQTDPAPSTPVSKPSGEDVQDDGSSSFNLSTDAEDTEYENLKRGVVPPPLDQSVASNYQTDGETSVFPNLVEEDDNKAFSSPWDPAVQEAFPSSPNPSDFVTNPTNFFKSAPGARTRSHSIGNPSTTPKSNSSGGSGSRVGEGNRRNFEDFANFADFANFESDWNQVTKADPPGNTKKTSKVYIETSRLASSAGRESSRSSSASQNTRETSLTELLAQAKSKSTRKSAGSVNSAPVQASSYSVRDSLQRRYESRSTTEGTGAASVSDIIQNLDAAAKTRENGSVRSAKERLKKRRQQAQESSESDEAAESWLFDEVTGALGPRGIAADLESLSGRSHTSGGGRSHKSHHSRKSKSRSRSRKSSSGESVGSKDSKRSNTSRRSRSSRYSHRSTRSYISQMSEQSRSVANDLLRLEMQLAMVGQQQDGSGDNKAAGADPAAASRSRSSKPRRSNGGARRSRITVLAPPGKLGIILANKADSKGTVVSGVRTSSVLAEKICPGDRIVAIDGEDVSLMTVSEITTIMARKADFERSLTVLTTPRSMDLHN